MVEAYAIGGFTQDQIAEAMGVDPKTLRLHCRKELDFGRMNVIAKVSGNAVRAACGAPAQFDEHGNEVRAEQKPEAWAICFVLKTLGKKQGWTERVEHTGKDGGPMEFDLSRLTDDELRAIESAQDILARHAPAGASVTGAGKTTH